MQSLLELPGVYTIANWNVFEVHCITISSAA